MEPLPAGFWDDGHAPAPDAARTSPAATVTEAATRSAPEVGTRSAAAAEAPSETPAETPDFGGPAPGATVAMLQRLFPGEVLHVEHAESEADDDAAQAEGAPPEEPSTSGTGDTRASTDERAAEDGLESPGSHHT